MKIKRVFYPVGHGGFSEEIFYKGNKKYLSIVFDCGTSKLELIDKALDKREEIYEKMNIKDTSIDSMFISHYHSDHINMLKDLKSRFKIKNIILPLISDVEKIYYLLDLLIKDNYDAGNKDEIIFFNDLFNGNLKDINIIFYMDIDQDNNRIDSMKHGDYFYQAKKIKKVDISNFNDNLKLISKNTRLHFKHIWGYIPYFFKGKKIEDDLAGDLNYKFNGLIDLDNYNSINITMLVDNIGEIKEHFKTIKKDMKDFKRYKHNPHENNMTLYSGPVNREEKNNSCLYTGDINSRDKTINDLISYYEKKGVSKEDFYTLVWPHHGSCQYYNEILHKNFQEFIIFANRRGKYSEISPCPALRHFIEKIDNIYWVDEENEYVHDFDVKKKSNILRGKKCEENNK